ncbi:unnamed protein product [Gongylonema pulchrum]|uniref:Uncharacterized protein n=1 Tax=Gongylonema pulchrum TaxID=637853 RepID=A0A3P6QNF9_9BILA|nr:unnamed protein product [Gongylonema pulchrum]
MELYTSDSQVAALTPAKSILLTDCLAIRIVYFRNTISSKFSLNSFRGPFEIIGYGIPIATYLCAFVPSQKGTFANSGKGSNLFLIALNNFFFDAAGDNRIIQIQQKNAPVLLIAVEDVEDWHYVLCKVAFPDQVYFFITHVIHLVHRC